jgi:hypothetical protein
MPLAPAPAFVEQAPRPLTELSRVPSVEAPGAVHDADDELISGATAGEDGATEPLPKCEPTDGLDGGDALPISEAGAEAVEQTELPWAKSAINNEALVPVLLQVDAFTRRAFELADRGAAFSARAEFTGALRLIVEALDTQQQTTLYSRSLTAGLTALKEADDFSAAAARGQVDVARTVAAHTTTVLKDQPLDDVSPLVARQRYLNYAKEQLTAASGMLPHSSLVLYGMGKLSLLSAPRDPASQLAATGRAMVWHQAALNADPRNFRAANELGVLLARHGDANTARALFEQSLRMSSQPAVWSNLAEVEQRLGNTQQAGLARRQADDNLCSRRQYRFAGSSGPDRTRPASNRGCSQAGQEKRQQLELLERIIVALKAC